MTGLHQSNRRNPGREKTQNKKRENKGNGGLDALETPRIRWVVSGRLSINAIDASLPLESPTETATDSVGWVGVISISEETDVGAVGREGKEPAARLYNPTPIPPFRRTGVGLVVKERSAAIRATTEQQIVLSDHTQARRSRFLHQPVCGSGA